MTDLEKIEDWVKENKFHHFEEQYSVDVDDLLIFIQSLKPKKEKLDFTNIHSKLQTRLKELTGKSQYKVQNKYNFLPSEKDLITALQKVCVKYKLKDVQKIQNLLLLHCEKSVKANFEYTLLLGYYISKNGISALASDMENTEEIVQESEIKPNIDSKNLF